MSNVNTLPEVIKANRDETANYLEAMFHKSFEAAKSEFEQKHPDTDCADIQNLLESGDKIIEELGMEEFQKYFLKPDGALDIAKIDAFNKLYSIKQILRGYAPVILERLLDTDTDYAFQEYKETIDLMHEVGCTFEEVSIFLHDAVDAKGATDHPTEHLNEHGLAFIERLLLSAELSADKRLEEIQGLIIETIKGPDINAHKKDTILDEIDRTQAWNRVQNLGANITQRKVEEYMFDKFGRKFAYKLDNAPRNWHDSDGKNNFEGFASMAKKSTEFKAILDQLIGTLENGIDLNKDLRSRDVYMQRLQDLKQARDNLLIVHDRSREIVQTLATQSPEERETFYKKVYMEEYDGLKKSFGSIYGHVDPKNNRGFDFYKDTKNYFEELRGEFQKDPPLYEIFDETFRTLRNNGMTVAKTQKRISGIMENESIDNLFSHNPFLEWAEEKGALSDKDILDIKAAAQDKISSLDEDRQDRIRNKVLDYALENKEGKTVLHYIREANPLRFDSNGYPSQNCSIHDLLDLQRLYPLTYEENMISDCPPHGAEKQKFLADLRGMTGMRHLILPEDRTTLPNQHTMTASFARNGGAKVLDARSKKYEAPEWFSYDPTDKRVIGTMRPQSDSGKTGGDTSMVEAIFVYYQVGAIAYDESASIYVYVAGGLSMHRNGSDVGMARRVVAQSLKRKAIERGKAFDMHNQSDRRIIRSALMEYSCEQGRSKRVYSVTPNQVSAGQLVKLAEKGKIYLDLIGKVSDYTYIQKPHELSPAMTYHAAKAQNDNINRFVAFRNVLKPDGDAIVNASARIIGAPYVVNNQTFGARPQSKVEYDTTKPPLPMGKEYLDLRAIGTDKTLYMQQTFGTAFGAGAMMKNFYEKVRASKEKNGNLSPNIYINSKDVRAFLDSPEWDFSVMSRALTEAGKVNPKRGLDQLGWADATFDDVIEIGKSVRTYMLEGDLKNYYMHYKEKHNGREITPEQAYLSHLYYDFTLTIGLVEAALNFELGQANLGSSLEDIIESARPANGALRLKLGKNTKKKWSDVPMIIEEHNKHMPAYAIQYMLNDEIQRLVEKENMDKTEAENLVGGLGFLRRTGSGFRTGTMSHWPFWTNVRNYGNNNVLPKVDLDLLPQTSLENTAKIGLSPEK